MAEQKLEELCEEHSQLSRELESEISTFQDQECAEQEKAAYEQEKQEIEQKKVDEDKEEKKNIMLSAIKSFVSNMLEGEEQFARFRQMEEDDKQKLEKLVQQDLKISKQRFQRPQDDDVVSQLELEVASISHGQDEITIENA
jgi:adenosyl cobinamide kinase/adenosyl cobinamide phosphate guanylyltransferase